ncbi:unnamed protein product [Brachionus calyciflorus]|uniref:MPN domain-containing protein n=1 Tax=Brachionus calyciflorus TaxID=104777 RepID=A0A813R252_9BILA|nr:unnamed protein product [Brachionus calyciflorus]
MNSQVNTFKDLIDEPDRRFKEFFNFHTDVKINPSFSIAKYIRSGRELIRMGNIYFSEHDYLQAFVLYSRFAVLYSQTLKTHPEYPTCNKSDIAEINKQLTTIAFPRAEKLKIYIKEIFQNEANEHWKILDEQKNKKIIEDQEDEKLKNSILNNTELNELDELNKPVIDRTLKPKEKVSNFRPVFLPGDTMTKFLEIAYANTQRNIETCGILAGRLNQNKFTLTHCIIPKQKGTSDTCSTEHEHELCESIDSNNLITLGWIHTHPSQTAFLSSIDLHTHYGYQLMIPEAIAIVCAPSYNQNGIFILNPSGLQEISECSKDGFHPHTKNPELFEECDHVTLDNNLRIKIIDLRMVTSRSY